LTDVSQLLAASIIRAINHRWIVIGFQCRKCVVLCAGIITVGNDISQLFVSIVLSYYTGRGHRPRWIALGIYTVVLYCLMSALPHLLYGPGEDALALTVEYGGIVDLNATQEAISKCLLCREASVCGGR
jgi:hypothetical protein